MTRYPRRTNPGVRDGVVQKKHRTELSAHYKNYRQAVPVLDRLRPGRGYRHLIRKPDLARFVQILPDWNELSRGLDAVVLAPGSKDRMGYYDDGVVAVCAWEREVAGEWERGFVREHEGILERLGVSAERRSPDSVFLHWTDGTARAFQFLHVLLHELGHHHDRMTTRSERDCSRGEGYAELYANRYAQRIWEAYGEAFGFE